MLPDDVKYAGFWIRTGAALIDTLLIILVTFPLLVMIYGVTYFSSAADTPAGPADLLISWVAPAIATVAFWLYKQATPGKMLLSAKIVDAKTGNPLTLSQSVIRYIGYFVAALPLGIGILWVAFDARKQGWHDKLAGTVVIRQEKRGQGAA